MTFDINKLNINKMPAENIMFFCLEKRMAKSIMSMSFDRVTCGFCLCSQEWSWIVDMNRKYN